MGLMNIKIYNSTGPTVSPLNNEIKIGSLQLSNINVASNNGSNLDILQVENEQIPPKVTVNLFPQDNEKLKNRFSAVTTQEK